MALLGTSLRLNCKSGMRHSCKLTPPWAYSFPFEKQLIPGPYLSAILNEAVDDEILEASPALRVRKAIAKDHKEEISLLIASELNHLLETVEKHYPAHYTMFLLMVRTGMRIGEVTGLEWGDIDFNGRFIEVRRSIVRGRVSTPKSGKSRRVDMSPQLAGALRVHKTESKRKGLALGIGEPSLVFTNNKGGEIDLNNWRRVHIIRY